MNAGNILNIRRTVLTLAIAAVVALSTAYAPMVLDGVAGTSLTPSAYACQGNGTGC
ncbi:MAG: hypothetical protein AAF702_41495 [Chloroflexota bacterium]